MRGGIWGFGEATVLVAGHEIRVHEVSPRHVRVTIIGPGTLSEVLDLKLRRGQWYGTWDGTGEQVGPFGSIKAVVAALSEALAE